MAHNLYKNNMAYQEEIKPWHGLGTVSPELMTIEEALSLSGSDYKVAKDPVYRERNGQIVAIPDQYVTVNEDNGEVLGMVGSKYEVFQTKDRLEPFRPILDDRIATCGALGNGERFWVLALADNEGWEVVPGCKLDSYFLLTGSHDGSLSTECRHTEIAVVCQNTFNQALSGKQANISIRTTAGAPMRLAEAAKIMADHKAYLQETHQAYSRFADFRVDDWAVEQYLSALVGDPTALAEGRGRTICQNRREEILNLYEGRGMGSMLEGVAGTAMGLWMAASEYADYKFPQRGGQDRSNSIMFGSALQFKQKAFDIGLELVGVSK